MINRAPRLLLRRFGILNASGLRPAASESWPLCDAESPRFLTLRKVRDEDHHRHFSGITRHTTQFLFKIEVRGDRPQPDQVLFARLSLNSDGQIGRRFRK
jgi:hypothetical protein